jgi:hypothetical protein
MNDHERGFVEFLAEPSKRRVLTLLEMGQKRRRQLRSMLDHEIVLDQSCCEHLGGAGAFADAVEATLCGRGAPPTCFVIAANSKLDGRDMPLRDALDAVIGMGSGAFLSCIPGRLGFYEYEEMKSSYILSRQISAS